MEVILLGLAYLFVALVALMLIGHLVLAMLKGSPRFLRPIWCKMTWHSWPVGFKHESFDGCSVHARCKWCGYKGMIDSQGNLF